jgi:hypothetical protein
MKCLALVLPLLLFGCGGRPDMGDTEFSNDFDVCLAAHVACGRHAPGVRRRTRTALMALGGAILLPKREVS